MVGVVAVLVVVPICSWRVGGRSRHRLRRCKGSACRSRPRWVSFGLLGQSLGQVLASGILRRSCRLAGPPAGPRKLAGGVTPTALGSSGSRGTPRWAMFHLNFKSTCDATTGNTTSMCERQADLHMFVNVTMYHTPYVDVNGFGMACVIRHVFLVILHCWLFRW